VKSKTLKAVILAAGKGTRMRDLTNEMPKPMLKVQDRPILEHIIEGLKESGIQEFLIVTGFKAEVVEDYFDDGTRWNVKILYARQMVQDGTGKAPELAMEFVGQDDFLLTYGDILVKPETYGEMISRFEALPEAAGLVTVTGSEDVTKGGLFFFDKDFFLEHLVEKPDLQQLEQLRQSGFLKSGEPAWYNAGIYIFTPDLFRFTRKLQKSPRGEYELTDALSAMVQEKKIIAGLKIPGRWVDVRDPEVLASLQD